MANCSTASFLLLQMMAFSDGSPNGGKAVRGRTDLAESLRELQAELPVNGEL
jgi:hypothetical protein